MSGSNINLEEVLKFMEDNKPREYLSQEELSILMLENSKLFLDYANEQQASNCNDLAPSVYFKSLNKLEQNLVKILSSVEPNEFLSGDTVDEAIRLFRDSKIDYYDSR